MENIILIGHGSPKKDANNIDEVGRLLHSKIHNGCSSNCVKVAYLQFAQPDIMSAIRQCVEDGAGRVILHPYFLYSGMHVTKDIPEAIRAAGALYPEVEFIYTEPLGIHDKLVQIVVERIDEKKLANNRPSTDSEVFTQHPIEKKSFDIIGDSIDLSGVPEERLPIIKRVIHSTADFEFRDTLTFHPDAIKAGIEAIRSGKDILTDVEMVKTGINKRLLLKWGGRVICNLQQPVLSSQKPEGRTRSEMGIKAALGKGNNIGIIAIGNAPTALLKAIEILSIPHSSLPTPHHTPLVVGVPVGFVESLESKELLAAQTFPFITNLGRKGGTPVAVAIINALLIMADGGKL